MSDDLIKNVSLFSDEDPQGLGAEVRVMGTTPVVLVPNTVSPRESVDGKRMIPVVPPEGVDPLIFRRILDGAFSRYLAAGDLSPNHIAQLARVKTEYISQVLATEEAQSALQLRGVDTEKTGALTSQQVAALSILTDTASRDSWNRRLQKCGISAAQFQAWMRNPSFASAYKAYAEAITSNSSTALVELGRRVGEGDLAAIKLQLEINGRHNPMKDSQIDSLVIINKVLDVLATVLAGQPELLMRAAQEMRGIATQVQGNDIKVVEM